MKERKISPVSRLIQDCRNEQVVLNSLLKRFRGVHPVLVIPDVHGRFQLSEEQAGAIAACTSCKAAKTGGWLSVFSAWRQKA